MKRHFKWAIDNESQKESLPIKRYCLKSNVILLTCPVGSSADVDPHPLFQI